jgi:hypothetical protein
MSGLIVVNITAFSLMLQKFAHKNAFQLLLSGAGWNRKGPDIYFRFIYTLCEAK